MKDLQLPVHHNLLYLTDAQGDHKRGLQKVETEKEDVSRHLKKTRSLLDEQVSKLKAQVSHCHIA